MTFYNLPHKFNMVFKSFLASGVLFVALLLFSTKSYAYNGIYLTFTTSYPDGIVSDTDCLSKISGSFNFTNSSADTFILYAITSSGKIELSSWSRAAAGSSTITFGTSSPMFVDGLVYDLYFEAVNKTQFTVSSQNITVSCSDISVVSNFINNGYTYSTFFSDTNNTTNFGKYSFGDACLMSGSFVGTSISFGANLNSFFNVAKSPTDKYLFYVYVDCALPNLASYLTDGYVTWLSGSSWKQSHVYTSSYFVSSNGYGSIFCFEFEATSSLTYLPFWFTLNFNRSIDFKYVKAGLLLYNGSAADILKYMENQWDNTSVAVDSINNKITDVNTTHSSVVSIDNNAISTYDTYYSNAGIDSFSIAGVGSELVLFSTIANAIYDKFPVKLRLVFVGSLVFGLFALVLSATGRIIKKEDFNARRRK